MDPALFDHVADVLRGMVPVELGDVRARTGRWAIKAWLDDDEPPRQHFEAQILAAHHVAGAKSLGLEIGFHSEDRKEPVNEAVLAQLLTKERAWRRALGKEPVAGPFLGRAKNWRRISETWADPDLSSADVAIDIGVRLGEYMTTLAPLVRASVASGNG